MFCNSSLASRKQLSSFGLVGVLGLGANLVVTAFVSEAINVAVELAYLMGYVSALVIGFVLCRYFVFKTTNYTPGAQLTAFVISSTIFRGLEYGASLFLHVVLGVNYLLAIVIVAVGGFFLKFAFYRSHIFAKT
ncbi:MAG: hypothetical protein CMF67_10515 [Magnetovibrio sp.]|nr:hypothetical protein [Magnetovibrio sp.]|tara:strand:- start:811 stop:1212 length:402 start_codon:yes stop_codon:yes gene_type:complete